MKFERRENSSIDEEILESETGMCDCGHADFVHKNIDVPLRDPNNRWSQYGECVLCMCPRFSLQHSMKHKEYLRVRWNNERPLNGSDSQ